MSWTGAGTSKPVMFSRASRLATTVVVALTLGVGACGEDDVERGVEEGAKEAREAGRDAKQAGKDAAGEVEKGAKEAEREVEEE